MSLYPLKFRPRFVEKIWGGRKIETVLGKPLPPGKPIGESWELYDFPPGVVDESNGWVSSEIANGPLAGRTLHQLVGEFGARAARRRPAARRHGQFPILIKFLDAREDLSVQVHPDRAVRRRAPRRASEERGVVRHRRTTRVRSIYKGLQPGHDARDVRAGDRAAGRSRSSVERGRGEAGRIASTCPAARSTRLGAGILVAEVQTPSDTTFRVFDFNRIDPTTGKPRQAARRAGAGVHRLLRPRARAAAVAHVAGFFTTVTRLVSSAYFKLEKVRFTEGVEEPVPYDQPVVWMMLEGEAEVRVDGVREPTRSRAAKRSCCRRR